MTCMVCGFQSYCLPIGTDESCLDDTPRRLAPQALSATEYVCDMAPRFCSDEYCNSQTRAAMLQLAFETEYEDTALTAFNKAFAYYDRTYHTRNYGRVIAILQSSACGKSRLVAELAKIVSAVRKLVLQAIYFWFLQNPTFSICFRESPRASTGWPPGDMAVWEYFHSPKSNDFQVCSFSFLLLIFLYPQSRAKSSLPLFWVHSSKNWRQGWTTMTKASPCSISGCTEFPIHPRRLHEINSLNPLLLRHTPY